MSKIETVCPFCKKPTVVEKSSFGALADGLQNIQCPHCSKRWAEDLSVTGKLAKSAPAPSTEAPAPSTELAELRVQLNAQFAELLSKIKGLTERRVAASRPPKISTMRL